jgi:hypothetical protein
VVLRTQKCDLLQTAALETGRKYKEARKCWKEGRSLCEKSEVVNQYFRLKTTEAWIDNPKFYKRMNYNEEVISERDS